MKQKYGLYWAFGVSIIAGLVLWENIVQSKIDPKAKLKLRLRKPDIVDITFVGYNRWNYVMRNQGSVMYDVPDANGNSNNAGGEFPRGLTSIYFGDITNTSIIFAAGAWIGAIKEGIPVVSETQFATEFQPGRISNSGVHFDFLQAENRDTLSNRVYLIDQTRSGSDYDNWPPDALRDADGNPALIADAQTWVVFNDLDVELSQEGTVQSPNAGLGVQVTLESFAFSNSFWSDVVLLKYTIENKSNLDYNSSYFGFYADEDVDNAGNDVLGSDSIRGLGYVYNFNNLDEPLCVGIDFLQGPIVDASSLHTLYADKFQNRDFRMIYDPNSNRFKKEVLPSNLINISATTHNTYPGAADPYNNSQRYNMLQGKTTSGGGDLNNYNGWFFPGNPVTGSGALHSGATDQRSLLATGPFRLTPGEPQEVWVAVIGGQGGDRLEAVQKMFVTDDLIQKSFDAGLVMPKAPPSPVVSASTLDGRVILTWQDNAESTTDDYGELLDVTTSNGFTADYVKHDFQGYRVYKSLTGLEGSFTKLAEFDKDDGILNVQELYYDDRGALAFRETILGSDNGIRREFIDEDVRNLTRYYYSVTAYDAQPSILFDTISVDHPTLGTVKMPSNIPVSMESAMLSSLITVIPKSSPIGITDTTGLPSTTATRIVGISDGIVKLEIIDPTKVQTADYQIEFFMIPHDSGGHAISDSSIPPEGTLAYRFIIDGEVQPIDSRSDDPSTFYDQNANGIFDSAQDITLDERYFATNISLKNSFFVFNLDSSGVIIGGIRVRVFHEPAGIKQFLCVSNATGVLNPPDMAAFAFNGWNFPTVNGLPPGPGNDRPAIPNLSAVAAAASVANGGLWGFHVGGGSGPYNDGSPTSFISRVFRNDNLSRFTSYDYEMRFNASGGFASDVSNGQLMSIPFEFWRIGANSPNDPSDDYRMIPFINDIDTTNSFNLIRQDHPLSGGDNDPFTDWIDWRLPLDFTTSTSGYQNFVSGETCGGTCDYPEVMARTVLCNFNGGSVNGTWPANVNQLMPATGTVYRIVSTKPILANDVYAFSSVGYSEVTSSKQRHRDLKSVRVVPNPFYYVSNFGVPETLVKFTNLPGSCSIKIFNVAGDLVKTLRHNSSSNNDRPDTGDNSLELETSVESWNLKTETNRNVAPGVYIALIEAKGFGKKIVKFAVIR